ncbi:MAG: hypothetical protein R2712_09150 [Vicinamibacterales bacterium]
MTHRRAIARVFVALGVAALFLVAPASAEVTRVEITRRERVGTSGYEKLVGTAHFAVNPATAANRIIVDLEKVPVNADGMVEFSADLYILRPVDPARSNGVVLMDVLNRGRKMVLNGFNRGGTSDPATEADLGDGFLMARGFTIVWIGWEFDVRRADAASGREARGAGMGIQLPTARGVSGVVRAGFTPSDEGPQTVGDLAGYCPFEEDVRARRRSRSATASSDHARRSRVTASRYVATR